MVGYAGRLGGGFEGLGPLGAALVGGGVVTGALSHGVFTSMLAKWLASRVEGGSEVEEYNKADLLLSLIYAIPIGGFGIARFTKYNYESDILDAIGCFALGAGAYEVGSFTEVLGSLVKEL